MPRLPVTRRSGYVLAGLTTIMLVLGAVHQAMLYVFPINSVPGFIPVSPAERAALARPDTEARPPADTPTVDALLAQIAAQDLPPWPEGDKGRSPRTLVARYMTGWDAEPLNEYLLGAEQIRGMGSTWTFHYGDHDFGTAWLTVLLYQAPGRLSPAAEQHLLDELLPVEGPGPDLTVPRSLGAVFDTENHVLMVESTRYLKNQYLRAQGNPDPRYDNEANGMTDWILGYLKHLREDGMYEFNSLPYEGYAIPPILSLESFAEPPEVAGMARALLDELAWETSRRTLDYRQWGPFRRQLGYMARTSLHDHSMPAFMRLWGAPPEGEAIEIAHRRHHAAGGAMRSYRPPLHTLAWMEEKPEHYYLRRAHVPHGSPELLSGGPGYLLTAGGVWRGAWNRVVPRPTLLMLNDGAGDAMKCVHLPAGGDVRRQNNTGVWERFAVAEGPVHVPDGWTPVREVGDFAAYLPTPEDAPAVVVYSTPEVGAVWLDPERDAESALTRVRAVNTAQALPTRAVTLDDTTLTYDLDARHHLWIIQTADGLPVQRRHESWPRGLSAVQAK